MVKDYISLADRRHDLPGKVEGARGIDVVGLGYVCHLVPHQTLVMTAIDVTQCTVFWCSVVQAYPRGENIIAVCHAKVPAEFHGAIRTRCCLLCS